MLTCSWQSSLNGWEQLYKFIYTANKFAVNMNDWRGSISCTQHRVDFWVFTDLKLDVSQLWSLETGTANACEFQGQISERKVLMISLAIFVPSATGCRQAKQLIKKEKMENVSLDFASSPITLAEETVLGMKRQCLYLDSHIDKLWYRTGAFYGWRETVVRKCSSFLDYIYRPFFCAWIIFCRSV